MGWLVGLSRLDPIRVNMANSDMVTASHARFVVKLQTTCGWQHCIGLVKLKPGALGNGALFLALQLTLTRLRQSLLQRTGGDRVMTQVLAPISQFGLGSLLRYAKKSQFVTGIFSIPDSFPITSISWAVPVILAKPNITI